MSRMLKVFWSEGSCFDLSCVGLFHFQLNCTNHLVRYAPILVQGKIYNKLTLVSKKFFYKINHFFKKMDQVRFLIRYIGKSKKEKN